MNKPAVAIVILNWNGWEDTIECLESLYQINYHNYNVILVDNASRDESLEKIKEYIEGKIRVKSKFFSYNSNNKPLNVAYYENEESEIENNIDFDPNDLIVIKNDINYGFAEGNNMGIKFALKNLNPNYILLLNNDTVVDKYFLNYMVETGEKDKKIGILGPKIYYYDNPQTIWCIGGKIDWKLARGLHVGTNEVDTGQYNRMKEFDYISGSAFLVKKEVIDKIGLMDEKFFLYFEESDLALRASKNGYTSVYAPEAKIWHKVSKSGGGLSKPIGLYYITRNRWLFMKKWAKRSDYALFVVYQAVGAIIFPIVLSIYYKNRKLFGAYYRGLIKGLENK
ncbi:glycosyltransferase family 2 protein [Methanobacterium oryzae]|uniref:glycosyltransferase family 2 protein n=1 Tax=Methanobacterium oryzae TaxID=69540 RepID=UPI003D2253B8